MLDGAGQSSSTWPWSRSNICAWGMLVLLGRRELGLAILGRAETNETWQLLTLLSLPSNI
uniref:Uncharacterized protein n=1 Tax=Triticum urartu TaxID=4572 RepID=A0A8R7UG05_TRIUA